MSNPDKGSWFTDFFRRFFSKRVLPYWCIVAMDTAIVFLSCMFVFWLSRRSMLMFEYRREIVCTAAMYSILGWVGIRLLRTYSGVLRYSSFVDLRRVAQANVVSLVLAIVVSQIMRWQSVLSLSALTVLETIVVFLVAMMAQWAMRVTVKMVFDSTNDSGRAQPALIYGALTGGVGMAKYIRGQQPKQFDLKGFITHETRIRDMELMGVPVYTVDDDIAEVIGRRGITAVLVSPQRVDEFRRNQKIQDEIISTGCKIYMTQEAREASVRDGELTDDDFTDIQLHEVSVEELLPRQQIHVDLKSVAELLEGRRVLITGSAGSIGSELVRQIAAFKPAKMLLIDQAESPQHDIRLMMAREFPDVEAETTVASIERESRMEDLFERFRPEYVFHAAAYKHVPMMEDNPSAAVMNNVLGTKILADLSVRYGVQKFVMISTDKAVNPTNVMGCSKRICEIYVQALGRTEKTTQFITTRFGNVLGSNGSVIPLFQEQIKHGGPVTVTDERIVRYFMLIPEACKLVLEAGTKGNGGEIFVFDMGEPVKIVDLARRMIALSGAKDVQIEYTGLREGEKLYEEVLSEREETKPTFHEKIRIAKVREYDYEDVRREVDELVEISKGFDSMATVRKMKQIVPEYKSNNSVYEAIDRELEAAAKS